MLRLPRWPGVERLEQIERLGATDLPDEDAIRPVTKRRADQIRNGHRRQRLFLAERDLRAPCLEAEQVRLVEMNLGRFLDDDDAIAVRNARRQRIEEGRLARAGAARDQDVLLRCDGVRQLRRQRRREGAHVDEVVQAVAARKLPDRQAPVRPRRTAGTSRRRGSRPRAGHPGSAGRRRFRPRRRARCS